MPLAFSSLPSSLSLPSPPFLSTSPQQRQPLIPLHPAQDPENSDRMVLMCSALPQKSSEDHSVGAYVSNTVTQSLVC